MDNENKTVEMASDASNKKGNNRNHKNKNGHRSGGQDKRLGRRCQDPMWYAADEAALKNMASLPWNKVIGDALSYNGGDRVPGIIIYPFLPTINTGFSTNSYARRAADIYYQALTQGYTGGVEFEAPDLLFTALAAESLFYLMIEGKRAYGSLNYYLQLNSYYARSIVEALGFDYDDLKSDMANFRTEFNIRVNQIAKSVAVPKSFMIGDRWEFICSFLFTDVEAADYSTVFAYRPAGYLKYDATTMTTGTSLAMISRPEKYTVNSYFAMIDTLLRALVDDDVRGMFGALRRVYQDAEFKKPTALDENFVTEIRRNDVVSAALHNAYPLERVKYYSLGTAGDLVDNTGIAIFQTASGEIVSNALTCSITAADAADTAFPFPEEYLLDIFDNNTTPGIVIDTTAHWHVVNAAATVTTAGTKKWVPVQGRSELLLNPIMYTYELGTTVTDPPLVPYKIRMFYRAGDSTFNTSDMQMWAAFSHVNSHTFVRAYAKPGDSRPGCRIVRQFGELDRYTTVAPETVADLQSRCMFKMLLLPEAQKSTTR